MSVPEALAPAFAAGFAIQRAVDLVDSFLNTKGKYKKSILGCVSVALAWLIVWFSNDSLLILSQLVPAASKVADRTVTVLVISAGTDGFNSIMKFLAYTKEAKKEIAAGPKASPDAKDQPDGGSK